MDSSEISRNCKLIQSELGRSIDTLSIESVMTKLNNLVQYSGLSAELVAQSERLILQRQKPALLNAVKAQIPAGMQKKFVESECAEEVMLHTLSDRLNAAITHSQDALRTIISMRKAEMENSI